MKNKVILLKDIKNWKISDKEKLKKEISMISNNLSVERPDIKWWAELNTPVYFRIYPKEFEYSFIKPNEQENYFELSSYVMAILFNCYRMGDMKYFQ